MTLIVEDGTGKVDSESFVSVIDADIYWSKHNSPSEWTSATEASKESALRYATLYLDDNVSWYSNRLTDTQALEWPRDAFTTPSGREIAKGTIPQKVKDAVCELALQNIKEAFNDASSEGVKSERLGDASITYSGNGSKKNFTFIKTSLKDYGFTNKANVNRLYRN